MFSPFWADFNTAVGGNWYYRRLTQSDLQMVNDIVGYELDKPNFQGVTGVVVTYSQVNFYGSQSSTYGRDRKNSVQAILVHDNNWSIAIFNYGDIEWTTGTASGGSSCTGLDGTPAQIGFNDGRGNYYSVPGSQTNDIINIEERTNVKSTGRFVFIVNGTAITDPNPNAINQIPTTPTTTTTTTTTTSTTTTTTTTTTSIPKTYTSFEDIIQTFIGDADKIIQNGCFCPRFDSQAAEELVRGRAVDDTDRICRELVYCQQCACEQVCINETGYPFQITYDEITGEIGCDDRQNNACQQAQCGCNVNKLNKLIQEVDNNGYVDEPKQCEAFDGGVSGVQNVCCGIGYEWVVYNAAGDLRCEVIGNSVNLIELSTGRIKQQVN